MTIKTITNNYDNYAKWFYHYTAEGKDELRQKSPAKNWGQAQVSCVWPTTNCVTHWGTIENEF